MLASAAITLCRREGRAGLDALLVEVRRYSDILLGRVSHCEGFVANVLQVSTPLGAVKTVANVPSTLLYSKISLRLGLFVEVATLT